MRSRLFSAVALGLLFVPQVVPVSAQHQTPPGTTHEGHQKPMEKDAALKARGAVAMGFDQDTTSHQFLLADTGGSIEVSVKDTADAKNLAAIRTHLQEIAAAFGRGDFSKPFQTHAEEPAGVDQLKALRHRISYSYEETPLGGRVRITTTDPDARKAVHDFLKYQIAEHHTAR